MRKIRIDFCDFWHGFNKTDNWFWHLLRERFDVELSDRPDFLFYSHPQDHQHRVQNCVKIWFAVESWLPDWNTCDYALTYHHLDDARHLRLPLYVVYVPAERLVKRNWDFDEILARKTKFCGAVISNPTPKRGRERIEFFHKLDARLRIDSGGRFANNIGGPVPYGSLNKIAWLEPFRFNMAFENECLSGYTTEKIVQAVAAHCVPIYWGDPKIAEEFNPKSFLNLADFLSPEELIDRIVEVERNPAAYEAILREPFFHRDIPNESYARGRLLDFFEKVFSTPITPVSRRRKWYQLGRWLPVKQNRPHPTDALGL